MFGGPTLRGVCAQVRRPVREPFFARRPVLACIITIIVQRKSFDAEYVRRLIHCDPETERDFVAYFGELLAIKLQSRLRAPELIQDVTQETFLRVLKTLRQSGIESPEAFGSFVNSVCNNILFEVYRAQSRAALEKSKPFKDPIVTEITLATEFWPAEEYHQDYYLKNPLRYAYYRAG